MTENTPPPVDPPVDPPAEPLAGSPAPPPPPYGQPPAGQQPPPPPAYQQQPPPAYQQGYQQPPPAYQQPGYQQPGYPVAPAMLSPSDERTWGTAAHWSALVAMLIGGLSFLGPLIVMLTQGNKSPWVRRQAVESLNFQISMAIYAIVSAILIIVLIGLVLLLVVFAFAVIMPIVASIKTSNGEDYRYPLTIRLVS